MFKSDIKEVAGLPIVVGEPVIADLLQTLEGTTVEQYKIINVAKIMLPLQIGTYKCDIGFWHTTRSEVAYKLIDKCADTKAVVNQFNALDLFGSTQGVENQGWNYKKQCNEISAALLAQLGATLNTEQEEQLGRLIKEAAAYSTQNLIEKNLTSLTYQCEGLNGEIVLKKYHELEDYEVIWGGFTESRISNVFKDSLTRNNTKYAAAITQQSIDGISAQLAQIRGGELQARADYTEASRAFGMAVERREAHTYLLSQPTTNKNSILMQRASLAVGVAYIEAKVWKDRVIEEIRLDNEICKQLIKKQASRERFLVTLCNRKVV